MFIIKTTVVDIMNNEVSDNKPVRNYQKELEKIIDSHGKENRRPTLLLHSCCAPCSSYCLEYLSQFFDITIFYYNPNITDVNEYNRRTAEQERLINCLNEKYNRSIKFIIGEYDPDRFLNAVKGLENEKEGGARCSVCFAIRLSEAAKLAAENGFDYFTTTLTISPLKNAKLLNEIGERFSEQYNVKFLPSDFKKKNGYKRSVELSKEYELYRQNYCGCEFSKNQAANI